MNQIVTHESGTSFNGAGAVNVFRLLTLRSGLMFEVRCPGMQMTRGRSCLAIAKDTTGLKTRDRMKHVDWIDAELARIKASGEVEIINDGEHA